MGKRGARHHSHTYSVGRVLELGKGLQRVFGCAREHYFLAVPALQRRERHHNVFRAQTQEATETDSTA